MNRHLLFPTTILSVLSATALPAQEKAQEKATPQPRYASAVLLVRGAPADVILNQSLLQAIVRSPRMQKVVADAAGERFAASPPAQVDVALPAPHAAGTFQLHVEINLHTRNPWTEEDSGKVLDAVLGDLRAKIDHLMFEGPRRAYEDRIATLRQRLDDLEGERAKRLGEAAGIEGGVTPIEHLQKQRLDLDQRLLEARLEIATETAAQERLEKMRAQLDEQTADLYGQRTEAQKRRHEIGLQIAQLDEEIKKLGTRSPTDLQELPKQRERLVALQEQNAVSEREYDRIAGQLLVPERVLAQVVELMPASILARQRAEARLRSLEGFTREQSVREQEVAGRSKNAAAVREAAERLRGDAVVVQSLLTEIRGRYERLEPVRYEVFPGSR